MQKHAHLNIKLHPSHKTQLKKGDHVTKGDVLADTPQEIDELDLVSLLKIKPEQISKFVTVHPGDEIAVGQVIAKKGGAFSSQVVRSPVSGVFGWSDEKNGIAAIKKTADTSAIHAPADGVIIDVKDEENQLVIEVEGTVLEAIRGSGSPVVGSLSFMENMGAELPGDLEHTIVVVKDAPSSLIAKIDALGARAVISEIVEETHLELPYLVIESIDVLNRFHGRSVMVLGQESQLLVLENHSSSVQKSRK